MSARVPVLIVGAGPTGLMLALWLARSGVPVRIIDRTSGPGTTSRALATHARTLEFFRQLGIADEAIARGLEFQAARLWARGRQVARIVMGDVGRGLSPFPYVLALGQDRQEALLVEKLAELGVHVERETTLKSFEEHADRVSLSIESPAGTEYGECDWLAGCDGPHSTVREGLDMAFAGGTYEHVFYVADIKGTGPAINGDLNVALDRSDFLAVFPMPGEGNARLVGTVKPSAEDTDRKLTFEDVSGNILDRMRFRIDRVNWFSTYHVHHRVARRFRCGRVFLLGDAAHIHSPVGGQGMNTGIGDAVNLAWKLAMVVQRRAPEKLLDSYPAERMPFARRLVATTDRAFVIATRDGPIARFVRLQVVPRVMPALMRREAARRYFFRNLSQIAIEYRSSPLSVDRAGSVHAGDRLPWVPDNFAPLASLQWQVHVHGRSNAEFEARCKALGLPVHVFAWSDAASTAGYARDAAYLVRPDGYVAFADPEAKGDALERYWARQGLVPPTA